MCETLPTKVYPSYQRKSIGNQESAAKIRHIRRCYAVQSTTLLLPRLQKGSRLHSTLSAPVRVPQRPPTFVCVGNGIRPCLRISKASVFNYLTPTAILRQTSGWMPWVIYPGSLEPKHTSIYIVDLLKPVSRFSEFVLKLALSGISSINSTFE